MKKNIDIIIVDDNLPFRKNFKTYIESNLDLNVIAEASNGHEFLNLPTIHYADMIFMDIAMKGMDGFEATRKAIWAHSKIKVIAITMHSEKDFLIKLIETGFKGCVFKSNIYEDLPKAIKVVMQGAFFFPGEIIDK